MNFVFRNSMIEIFFPKEKYILSDYDSSLSNTNAENFLWINFLKPSPNTEDILQQISELKSNLKISIKSANSQPIYVLGLFAPKLYSSAILTEHRLIDEIYKFNKNILELSGKTNNVFYLDPNQLLKYIGQDYFSSKYYFSSSSIVSPLCANNFKLWLEDIELIISHKRKKLLILDLDNTLWGGILGEDGYNRIQIGNTYPGNVYLYLQKKVKELSSLGVILTACSKNNIDDVNEGFLKNKNMHLKLEDFSIIKANWQDKTNNIKSIISEINIGEDACIFIDDNPLERDMVRSNFPNLIVPEFPSKEYDIPAFIDNLSFRYFFSKKLTDEDVNKKNQYKIKLQAEKEESESSTKDEFLKNLNLEGYVFADPVPHILRISQMTQKTNQFNLTTVRLSESEIKKNIESGNYIFPLKIKDKYGDHGITSLIIASKTPNLNEVDISIFLMSCRILGRDIEYEFLKWSLLALYKKGVKTVKASYVMTKKNNQVINLYENAGFEIINKQDSQKDYKIDLKKWIHKNSIESKYINIMEAK